MTDPARGVAAMLGACCIWGLSALYFKALDAVPPGDVLAHRTVWSAVVFGAYLLLRGRGREIGRALADRRALPVIAAASVLIAVNWLGFIYAVQSGQALEASLGYYVFPLVAVTLGVFVLGERLSLLQAAAVGLAAFAVILLAFGLGAPPWIALVVATSFGLYGLVKKRLALGPVLSVSLEMLLLAPIALLWLGAPQGMAWQPGGVLGGTPLMAILLVGLGPLSATPLILFSYAAKRVSYATIGLIQYLNPTLQFAVAVLLFGEPFGRWHAVAFALIWTSLALYSWEAWRRERLARRRSVSSGTSARASR